MNLKRLALVAGILASTIYPAFASKAEDKVALGDKLMAGGDAQAALHFYDQAVDLNTSYWKAYLHRGDALMKLGERQLATDDYKKVLQLYPGCPEALARLSHGAHSPRRKKSHTASKAKTQ